MNKVVFNVTKLAVIVIVSSGAIFLSYADKLDPQAVVALLSACLGYVFGNSHGLMERKHQ